MFYYTVLYFSHFSFHSSLYNVSLARLTFFFSCSVTDLAYQLMALSVVIIFTVLDGRQAYLQPQLSGRILYQEKVIEHGRDLYTIVPLEKVTILSPKQFLPKPNHPYPSQKSNGRLLTDRQKRKATSGILT